MNRFLVASASGYLSELGWTDYSACASRFTNLEARVISAALPGSWVLEDEQFFEFQDMRNLPEFHFISERAA